MAFASAVIVGNVVRDPELKFVGNGKMPVCDISIAVEYGHKRGDEWVKDTSFFDCTAFNKTAEYAAEQLRKGSIVFVTGRLEQQTWEDKKTQEKRSKIKLIIDQFRGVQPEPRGSKQGSNERPAAPKQADAPSSFDDAPQGDDGSSIPF